MSHFIRHFRSCIIHNVHEFILILFAHNLRDERSKYHLPMIDEWLDKQWRYFLTKSSTRRPQERGSRVFAFYCDGVCARRMYAAHARDCLGDLKCAPSLYRLYLRGASGVSSAPTVIE